MKKKSTYSLLINANSEERARSFFEVSVYALVVLCIAVSGWQFASTSFVMPVKLKQPTTTSESMLAAAKAPVAQPPTLAARG